MPKRKTKMTWARGVAIGLVALFVIVVGVGAANGIADWTFKVEFDLSDRLANLIDADQQMASMQFGGSTSDNWNVGGNLAVTGTTGLTGNTTVTGTLGVTGDTTVDTFLQGSGVMIVYGTTTLTAAQICDYSVINIGLLADPVAGITLPATTTLNADCFSTDGQHKSLLIRDIATSTLAVTILKGAGIDLESDDNAGDVMAVAASLELEFWRISNTTTTVAVRPFTDAD